MDKDQKNLIKEIVTEAVHETLIDGKKSEAVESIVDKTVHKTLESLGFDVQNPRDVQADQLYLRKIRKGSQDVNIFVRRSAIWAFICGVAYMAFLGIKNYILGGGS